MILSKIEFSFTETNAKIVIEELWWKYLDAPKIDLKKKKRRRRGEEEKLAIM